MIIFTPNTVIRSTEINANFAEFTAKGFVTPDASWHYIGTAGEPAFANSWVNFEASETTYSQAKFRKNALGEVSILGIVKSGTVSATLPIFTLPVGYRPLKTLRFMCVANNTVGSLPIFSDGRVCLEAGSNAYLFLDGTAFKAEQ